MQNKRVKSGDNVLALLFISLLIAVFTLNVSFAAQYRRAAHEIEETRQLIEQLREENAALRRRMEDWLNEWDVMTAEVTAYAPLDPAAVNGMCYAGDPGTTASGAPTTPGLTVAAGPDVPFGTRIWAAGAMRTVQDRGGRIGPRDLDLCVESRAEALRFGRQRAVAVIERGY